VTDGLDGMAVGARPAAGSAPSTDLAPALRSAARRFGTPAYVTDLAAIDRAARDLQDAFPDPWIRSYSVKANDVPAVIDAVAGHGFGANVVSRGEWAAATRAGLPNDRITLEGVGKTPADLRAAARAAADDRPLRWVAIESAEEAEALASLVRRGDGPRLDVLYRLNPDVAPETQPGLAVGAGGSKFGMTEMEIGDAIERAGGPDGPLRSRGIHLHVGSQLGAVDAWRDAIVRDRGGRQVVLDAGMTELIRPALYGARHRIVALTSFGKDVEGIPPDDLGPAAVEGPICESTDSLGRHDLPPLRRGDLVAIADAGAYAASQSSTYNGRPRPPQVLLHEDGSLTLGRRRGTLVR